MAQHFFWHDQRLGFLKQSTYLLPLRTWIEVGIINYLSSTCFCRPMVMQKPALYV